MYNAEPPGGQPPFPPPGPGAPFGPGSGGPGSGGPFGPGPGRPGPFGPGPGGPGAPGQPYEGLAPILVAFDPPAPQSRVTVAFRIILAIPHLIVLYGLGVATEIVAIIGWFGALFTGRLPDFAAEFLTGYLGWLTRVYAYVALLTDVYPPFALSDAPYPVRIAARPGRLNRLAVLFRAFLLIPASIAVAVVGAGAFTLTLFVAWLIALFTGRLPGSLHYALASTLRYYVRVQGYTLMVTSAYPGGYFGDQPVAPAYNPEAFPPVYDPAAGFAPAPGIAPPTDPWRLVLSKGTRTLLGWFIAIGLVVFAGAIAASAVAASKAANNVSKVNAVNNLEAIVKPIDQAETSAASGIQACNQNLTCITKIDAHLATVYNTFAAKVVSVAVPTSQESAEETTIAADATKLAGVYAQLGNAKSADQYVSIANSSGVTNIAGKLGDDFDQLLTNLGATLVR